MTENSRERECIVCGLPDESTADGYSIVDGRIVSGPVCAEDSLSREPNAMSREEVKDIVGEIPDEVKQGLAVEMTRNIVEDGQYETKCPHCNDEPLQVDASVCIRCGNHIYERELPSIIGALVNGPDGGVWKVVSAYIESDEFEAVRLGSSDDKQSFTANDLAERSSEWRILPDYERTRRIEESI